ncbi:MAG TPA: prephenate dehydrogenase/arogenate dehydrogenase family protein [Granulicella sp.]|jgi:prephenate dehydrogenase|nr:prephenate dehydrogenase/arogenate dehydrogenase family protein [Granulicella sp.]
MIQRILILGTGLIGASTGLALRANGFTGEIAGFDASASELEAAQAAGAIDSFARSRPEAIEFARTADVILLAVPVLAILDWMQLLAPMLNEHPGGPPQLLTDVGSTKLQIAARARQLFPAKEGHAGGARFLPGHPMAGKESGGAALAEATLFRDAIWIFTPLEAQTEPAAAPSPLEAEWRALVAGFGARTLDLDPQRHDELCAWVSHLPQMLSTALSALLEDTFGADARSRDEIAAIGGRALRETTRLGASPYSMWRDIALSNTEPIAQTLLALEQRLQHLRENLRTPELREEFLLANRFRSRK